MNRFFFLAFTLTFNFLSAQIPQVPDRLEFADMKLKISAEAKISIQRDVNNLCKNPKYFEIKAERARTYFPIIERIFKDEGVPEQVKYLVLQESALISDAVSSANAVGYWQQKDFTAMELGLRIDRNIDERKSIVASTYAAARYFKKANQLFDNWLYSLQSYQMGIGGASRTLEDSGYGKKQLHVTTDTYWYVKKFLAYMIAFDGIMEKKADQPVTEYLHGAGKSINDIARETGFDETSLKEYNKWLLRGKIPNDRQYTVILPGKYESKDISKINASNNSDKKDIHIPSIESSSLIYPKIKHDKYKDHKYIVGVNGLPGIIASSTDNAQSLANKGDISLKQFNLYNDLKVGQKIVPGQVYYLRRKKKKAGTHYHTYQPGESLWTVSQKYGVRLDHLLSKNRIIEEENVKPGRVLWLRFIRPEAIAISYSKIEKSSPASDEDASEIIERDMKPLKTVSKPLQSPVTIETTEKPEPPEKPIEKPSDNTQEESSNEYISPGWDESAESNASIHYSTAGKEKHTHIVIKGETFYSISAKYEIPVPALLQWNNLNIKDIIYIGQKLTVYSNPKASSSVKTHIVEKGDTMYKIARIYGITVDEILEWNNKMDYHLKVGESLKVERD